MEWIVGDLRGTDWAAHAAAAGLATVPLLVRKHLLTGREWHGDARIGSESIGDDGTGV